MFRFTELKNNVMNKIKSMSVLAGALMLLSSSCAMVQSPLTGTIYTDLSYPLAVTDNSGSSKVGTGKATSILGAIATGDASVQTAAKAAGITKIRHVDVKATNILGLFATYTIFVYGE